MKRILAFDCSLDAFSALLAEDGEVRAALERERGAWRAEELVPLLRRVLEEARVGWTELDLLVPVVGPGSFTGVRTTVAAARALALATGLPVLPVSSLEAMAAQIAPAERPLLALIPGKRYSAYVQPFDAAGRAEEEPRCVPQAELPALARGRRVLAARAERLPAELREALAPEEVRPRAEGALRAALAAAAAGRTPLPGHRVRPLYLRAPDADPRAGRPLVDAA